MSPFEIHMGDNGDVTMKARTAALDDMRAEFAAREAAMLEREVEVAATVASCVVTARWARRLVAFAFGWPVLFEVAVHLPRWLH